MSTTLSEQRALTLPSKTSEYPSAQSRGECHLPLVARFVVVVTGANKGLGHSVCSILARRPWASEFAGSNTGLDSPSGAHSTLPDVVVVVMAARDSVRNSAARDDIVSAGVAGSDVTVVAGDGTGMRGVSTLCASGNLDAVGSSGNRPVIVVMDCLTMDVGEELSVKRGAQIVRERWGRVDLLINNAAIAPKDPANTTILEVSPQAATDIFQINVHGVLSVMDAFIPIMSHPKSSGNAQSGGYTMPHIVNVSSKSGIRVLDRSSQEVQQRIKSVSDIPSIISLMDEYISLLKIGKEHTEAQGWDTYIYGVSKAFVTMATKIYARKHPEVLVTCLHPGTCMTDLIPVCWYLTLQFYDANFGANAILKQAFSRPEPGSFCDEFGTPYPGF